jgi:hypothetical protein
LLAAILRLTGLDWDEYEHYHPDERFILWVATTIEFPDDVAEAFAPHRSSFNPFYWAPDADSEGIEVLQDQPRNFAYGHLPLYMGVAATKVVEQIAPAIRDALPPSWLLTQDILNAADHREFVHLAPVTRALTALVDVVTVLLVYLLGQQLFGTGAGLLAAAFLALNVMHIQLAHFFAVDPYLTLFTVLALLGMVMSAIRARSGQDSGWYVVAAVAIGLAVGSKFSAVLLFLPFAVTLAVDQHLSRRRAVMRLGAGLLIALVTFAITNPFALLDWSCDVVSSPVEIGPLTVPAIDWNSCYLKNVVNQSGMVRGGSAFPFTRQYTGTLPYVYPLLMQVRWGMGPLLGLAAIAGFGWTIWRGGRHLLQRGRGGVTREMAGAFGPELVLLSWTVPYFLVTGSFFVKFMRYMQPLTPFLMVYAAALLLSIRTRWLRGLAVGLTVVGTALYALSFVNMYGETHPWISASRWIFENVPRDSVLLSEKWDDPLPSSLEVDGEPHSRQIYDYEEQDWLGGVRDDDDSTKLGVNLSHLAQADYLVLSSARGHAVIPDLPDLYPLSSQYYQLLFSGRLGYEVVFVDGRSPMLGGPNLGPLHIWPERFANEQLDPPPQVVAFLESMAHITFGPADESFTVYDQPLPIIFENRGQLSVEEMLEQFQLDGQPAALEE